MKADPYEILGLERSASQDQIKKSFRKLARESHPDLNPDDSQAEERFKELQAAYALLSDPEQKRQFDAGVGPYAQGIEPEMFNLHDLPFDELFSEIFGGRTHSSVFIRLPDEQLRDDLDQRIKLRVPESGSKAGSTLAAKTPDGRRVQFKMPANAKNGTILKLAGKGLSFQQQTGDLYIELLLV